MHPVRTYSTCATCGTQLDVSPAMPPGHMTHYGCPPARDLFSVLRRKYLRALENDADEDTLRRLEHEIDNLDGREPQLQYAALQYAAWGWPVFPCVAGLKQPATKHGLKQASTDPEQIRDWWWRWPKANVAVPTGIAFDVIDIDPGGNTWWRHVNTPDGPLPDIHGRVSTPRVGGTHLYVAPTGMRNKIGLAPGVDYRGLGGYVLMPPSRLAPAAYDSPGGKKPPPILAYHPIYSWAIYPSPAIKPALTPAGG